jgi:hypothetical protein
MCWRSWLGFGIDVHARMDATAISYRCMQISPIDRRLRSFPAVKLEFWQLVQSSVGANCIDTKVSSEAGRVEVWGQTSFLSWFECAVVTCYPLSSQS